MKPFELFERCIAAFAYIGTMCHGANHHGTTQPLEIYLNPFDSTFGHEALIPYNYRSGPKYYYTNFHEILQNSKTITEKP